MTRRVLLALPATDFDPTESGVPWKALHEAGHEVVVATPEGERPEADSRLLTGRGLGLLAPLLRASSDGRAAYDAMSAEAFEQPLPFGSVVPGEFDGLLLPGGHAPGMKPYLESEPLFGIARHFIEAGKPVAAICHGVLVLARARNGAGESLLQGRRVTALLRSQEMLAWGLTTLWLDDYYRTYPTPVQVEITACLDDPSHFEQGPMPVARDAPHRLDRGFVVRDGNLVTARWPGDAHRLARELLAMLEVTPSHGGDGADHGLS